MTATYFTWETLATLAGATAATVVVVNVMRAAFQIDARWMALVVALCINASVWLFTGAAINDFPLAILNSFVVYAAATGLNQVAGAMTDNRRGAVRDLRDDQPGRWAAPWW